MPSSYLDAQISKFSSDMKSATSKISSGPPRPSSVRPNSALQSGRSTPVPSVSQTLPPPPTRSANEIYSQPQNTGVGMQLRTQVVYAIDYLRTKRDKALTLDEILSYLSKKDMSDRDKRSLQYLLKTDEKVEYKAEAGGLFRFRPLHNIRTTDELLAYLQNQTTAQGLSVKDLRDGWPDIDGTINKLAAKDKLLVTRNKKDEKPRMIWPNDPTLRVKVDTEFVDIWRKIQVPVEHATVVQALEKAGQMTAAKDKVFKVAKVIKKEKERKKPRRGGKKTNTHMEGLLRDYSHMQPGGKK